MYIDTNLEFSDGQAVTATANSTNIVDFGDAGDRGPGAGDFAVVFQVDTTTASAGSTTCTITLHTDSDVGFGTNTEILEIGNAVPKATLVAGYKIQKRLPVSGIQRYLRVTYTVAVANFSAGAFSCFLTPLAQTNKNSWPS